MEFREQLRRLREARAVHGNWYRSRYPDVEASGMSAVEHYLRYGAALGRDPGRHFETLYYLELNPEVADGPLNPLLHHVMHGTPGERIRRRRVRGGAPNRNRDAERLYMKHFALGFVEAPLVELAALVTDAGSEPGQRVTAVVMLAMVALGAGDDAACRTAVGLIEDLLDDAEATGLGGAASTAALLCLERLGETAAAEDFFDRATCVGAADADTRLAWARLVPDAERRLAWVNASLEAWGCPTLRLLPGEAAAFDRIAAAERPARLEEGLRVSVILPWDGREPGLATALRGLGSQGWRAVETIVVTPAAIDLPGGAVPRRLHDRLRHLRLPDDAAPGEAVNVGLEAASGAFVTIHEPGVWSFPGRFAAQVAALAAEPSAIGCRIEALTMAADLAPATLHPEGRFAMERGEGILYRTEALRGRFGRFDPVPRYQEFEMAARVQNQLGDAALTTAAAGPLAIVRGTLASPRALPVTFLGAVLDPPARDYLSAQGAWLEAADAADPVDPTGQRTIPFPAPALLKAPREVHYDVVIASDFRLHGGSTMSNRQEVLCQNAAGLRTGLLPLHRYDFGNMQRPILPELVRATVPGQSDLVPREGRVHCDLLVVRYPPVLQHFQTGLPQLEAQNCRVIMNQPPMSDYSEAGIKRYDFDRCVDNLERMFGVRDAIWHPIGPLMRNGLFEWHADTLSHIRLHDADWCNIIDLREWAHEQPREPAQGRRMRIGRHARDHFVKWPGTAEDILAIYPDDPSVEVRVLGGASAPVSIIGRQPENWVVHEFGSMPPSVFLREVDVFMYYTHPDWIEAFGRAIIEAMAAGVPVILPPIYRPLFHDAALYAEPADALAMARELFADPDRSAEQAQRAIDYIWREFSHSMHIERLAAAGVRAAESHDPGLREHFR